MPASTAIDIDAILATLPPAKPVGPFERWLSEDPERAERFWALIDAGRARGHGLETLIAAWDKATGATIPVKQNQVRVKLREREGRANGRQVPG